MAKLYLFEMDIKYTNINLFKIYPNCDFWFESIPYVNLDWTPKIIKDSEFFERLASSYVQMRQFLGKTLS
jgi:hypothetical protein